MNARPESTLQNEIDRLVGGELDKPAKRRLIERLEATPDGWRCCALAFLEAQSWSAAFGEMIAEDAEVPKNDVVSPAKPAQRRSSRWKTIASFAVVIAAAFAAGVGMSDIFSSRQTETLDRTTARTSDASAQSSEKERKSEQAPSDGEQPPLVGLVSVTNHGVTEAAFAVVGEEDPDEPPPAFDEPVVADYVRQVWRRKGYAIEQHRKVVSITLDGGRRFHFPVDWMQYRYVGERVY